MDVVEIYTDGACSGNPGPGGWAAILMCRGVEKEVSGYEADTTNNRMELTAVIEALSALKKPCEVSLYTDSSYVLNAFANGWIYNWVKNGWKTASKSEVLNSELWQRLLALTKTHKVAWVKVKGHADNEYNNRCDKLARDEIKKNYKA